MDVTKGQILVHPHHGPCKVTKTTKRSFQGKSVRYLKLQVLETDLVLGVPVDNVEETGLRPVLDPDSMRDVFTELAGESSPEISMWSRRIKADTDRLRSGNILTIAGLARDLTRRNEKKPLSFGEKSLLRDALLPLAAEVAIVMSVDVEEAERIITDSVLQETIPEIPKMAAAS